MREFVVAIAFAGSASRDHPAVLPGRHCYISSVSNDRLRLRASSLQYNCLGKTAFSVRVWVATVVTVVGVKVVVMMVTTRAPPSSRLCIGADTLVIGAKSCRAWPNWETWIGSEEVCQVVVSVGCTVQP